MARSGSMISYCIDLLYKPDLCRCIQGAANPKSVGDSFSTSSHERYLGRSSKVPVIPRKTSKISRKRLDSYERGIFDFNTEEVICREPSGFPPWDTLVRIGDLLDEQIKVRLST